MRSGALAALLVLAACTGAESPSHSATTPSTSAVIAAASPTPVAAASIPPSGSERLEGGCGATPIFKGGELPDWATINAPPRLPYVIARPGIALGYLFSYPLTAGNEANTKILWYVATPRRGQPLEAQGHPIGALTPTARFSKAADSGPGEIYPTGPTAPSAGCWHFTLTWQGGAQHADVDLLFR